MNRLLALMLIVAETALAPPKDSIRLDEKATEAILFCKANGLNTRYCILVDMSVHAGKNRLFLYDFDKKTVLTEGLCAHGRGGGSTPFKAIYSNAIGSNCTSLGKYRLGKRAYSNWGINVHYKMHGLESTNNNAFKRVVVLHSYDPVPEKEIYPMALFGVSSGCPVVSNETMRNIDSLIQKGAENMLLWIYQ